MSRSPGSFRERLIESHHDYDDEDDRTPKAPSSSSSSSAAWHASSINSASPAPPAHYSGEADGDTDDEDERYYEGEAQDDNDTVEAEGSSSTHMPGSSTSLSSKQRRYTCWGATRGCLMTKPQYISSLLLIFTLLITVLLLIVFLAIIPSIITSSISSSTLSINQISITQPNSDSRTMHLNSSMTITHAGSFSAQLHAMTVSISHMLSDGSYSASFGSIQVDPIFLNGDTQANIDSTFSISDMNAFDSFVHSLLQSSVVTWHFSATASITPYLGSLALPTYSSIAFNKDVSVNGCAGLNETWVDSFSLDSSNATHVNMRLNISVNNPSSFTISPLGTLHFRVQYLSQYIGDIYTPNAELLPGNNTLPMQGSLVRTEGSAEEILIQHFLTGQTVTVLATAADDASSIPLFNAGMQGLTLTTSVPGNEMNLVRSLGFDSLHLRPSATAASAHIDASINVTVNSPLGEGSPLLLNTMAIDSVLMYNGKPMGELVSAAVPVFPIFPPGSSITNSFTTTLRGELRLLGNGSVYSSFVSALLPASALSLVVSGTTNITASYVLGNLSVSSVPVTATSALPGLQSLAPVEEQGLNITGALNCSSPPCGVSVNMTASLFNPASVSVTLSSSALLLFFHGEQMGRMEADILDIQPGVNSLTLHGQLHPGNDSVTVSHFIDHFIHGQPVSVHLKGDSSDEVDGSASALTTAALQLDASVPGQDCADSLIEQIDLSNFSIAFGGDSVYITAAVRASFALPPNLVIPQLTIASTGMDATAWLNSSISLGSMSVASVPVVFEHHILPPDFLNLSLVHTELTVGKDQIDGFTAFADDLLLSSAASFTLSASATPLADTPLGPLSLSDVSANSSVAFAGLNRFISSSGSSLIRIDSFDIFETTADYMLVTTSISITNPANISLTSLGTLTLDLAFNNTRLGRVTLPSFSLPIGEMNHIAIANISRATVTTQTSLESFISAMINQTSSSIVLHGGLQQADGTIVPGTSIPLLQPTIQSFVSPTTFPGLPSPFILHFNAQLDVENIFLKQMPTTLTVHNPFSSYLTLHEVHIDVFSTDLKAQIGYWYAKDVDITFAPNTDNTSKVVLITLVLGNFLDEFLDIVRRKGVLPVNSVGWIRTSIRDSKVFESGGEGFTQLVYIDARNVPCYISCVCWCIACLPQEVEE